MKIFITGSHGLVGKAIMPTLIAEGHDVEPIVRGNDSGIAWNPPMEGPDPKLLQGCDAVIHLTGENIGARRWSTVQKQRLRESRVDATQVLCRSLAAMGKPPRVLIAASAIGIYGSRKDKVLTEKSSPGSDFLALLGCDWEAATDAVSDSGIRVVHLRLGLVLSADGGALAKMVTPFKLCLGGRVGSGQQWWSWVMLEDVVRTIQFVLENESVEGPVNVVAGTVTNRDFTASLAGALGRPAWFPLPAFAARVLLGEMADALLLSSTRVESRRLATYGFEFKHRELEPALRHLLAD